MRFNKVFGIGLPRTGTTSLNIALNTLGISSVHFPFSLYENNDRTILNQYTAFIDTPIPLLYQELDQLCPNSGFILTTRSVEDWLKSMEWLLTEGRRIWQWRTAYDDYHQDLFGSEKYQKMIYKARYKQFHDDVLHYFQGRDNLLVLDLEVGYGYEELCQFLGVPNYNAEYPKGNESRQANWLKKFAFQVGKYNQPLEKVIRRIDYYQKRAKEKIGKIY